MNEQHGFDGFWESLHLEAVGVGGAASGPGSYDAVVAALRAPEARPHIEGPARQGFAGRTFPAGSATAPLILLASLRARALEAPKDHPLATELLLDAVAPDLPARLAEALADPHLIGWLREGALRQVDPARASAWGLPALILGLGHRAFDIAERGATAGLNLVVDRTAIPFRFGSHLVQGFDFPAPEGRWGFDPAPIEVTGPEGEQVLRWLEACIWPSERERLSRLKATLTHRVHPWRGDSPAPVVHAGPCGWPELDAAVGDLPRDGGSHPRPLILYEASAPLPRSAELPPAGAEAEAETGPFSLLRREPRAVWSALVETGLPGARALRLEAVLCRDGVWHRVTLGETGYHSAAVTLDLIGPPRLKALWERTP